MGFQEDLAQYNAAPILDPSLKPQQEIKGYNFNDDLLQYTSLAQPLQAPTVSSDLAMENAGLIAQLKQKQAILPEKETVQSPNSSDYDLGTESYVPSAQISQDSMLSGASGISQRFGNPNAGLYGYSASGKANINRGTDVPLKQGTPQAAPPEGNWVVEKVASDGKWNTGWGNYVKMRNADTGETIQLSHLDKVYVKPGQKVTGTAVGTTGRTGRTTGSHADIEYTKDGKLQDITTSPYRKYLGLKSGQKVQGAKGGAVDKVKAYWNYINTPEYIDKFNKDMYSPDSVMGITAPVKVPKQILKNLTLEDRGIAGKFVEMYERGGNKANFGKAGKDAQYLLQGLRDAGVPIDVSATASKTAKFFNTLIEQADRLSKIKK